MREGETRGVEGGCVGQNLEIKTKNQREVGLVEL